MFFNFEEVWREAAAADARIGKHFGDWVALARGLHGMKAHLLAISGANSETSPLYRRAYEKWVPTREWASKRAGPNKKSFRSACYALVDNLDAINAWRAELAERDPGSRDRWQHPEVVMREWRKAQKAKEERGAAPRSTRLRSKRRCRRPGANSQRPRRRSRAWRRTAGADSTSTSTRSRTWAARSRASSSMTAGRGFGRR